MFSMPRNFSTFVDAALGRRDGLVLLVVLVVVVGLGAVAAELRLRVHLRDALERRREARELAVRSAASSGAPEMISGVRASSIRMLSTSSTMPKGWPRCTTSSSEPAMLSRR